MANYDNDFCDSVQMYYNDLKRCNPISRNEELMLIREAKNNNIEARNKILTSNLKFVFDVAKKYRGKGVAMPDLISEGNIGLTKAIGRFDETKGVKFISYAVWWIKQSIIDFIRKTNEVSENEYSSYDMIDEDLSNRDSDDEQTAFDDSRYSNYEIENEEYQEVDVSSLDEMMACLDERESEIVKLYFGIGAEKEANLEEIGEKFNLSKERVRQIKKTAIRKLRTKALMMDFGE